jgi:hypothetical protein
MLGVRVLAPTPAMASKAESNERAVPALAPTTVSGSFGSTTAPSPESDTGTTTARGGLTPSAATDDARLGMSGASTADKTLEVRPTLLLPSAANTAVPATNAVGPMGEAQTQDLSENGTVNPPATRTDDAPSQPAAASLPGTAGAGAEPTASPTNAAAAEPAAAKPADDDGTLAGAMRRAVGAHADDGAGPATQGRPGVAPPLRPAPGIVVSALRAVLPSARACLSPESTGVSGEIVFKSDGSVARVTFAGDGPEETCIRGALSRAHIDPFLDETFAAKVNVRP